MVKNVTLLYKEQTVQLQNPNYINHITNLLGTINGLSENKKRIKIVRNRPNSHLNLPLVCFSVELIEDGDASECNTKENILKVTIKLTALRSSLTFSQK